MLSILIPVYNYNCTALVRTLRQQCEQCHIAYQILIGNDASTLFLEEINALRSVPGAQVLSVTQNIGRSKMRNFLADNAAYNTLLFMDCDADASQNPQYIANYLPYIGKANSCTVGGTISHKRFYSAETSLNYLYDSVRETANKKNKQFTSFHFLIDKTLFNKVRFNEQISTYGFEDGFFGYEISQHTPITYIDNPLIHAGVRNNQDYLAKIDELCATLVKLYFSDQKETLLKVSKLARYVHYLHRLHLCSLIAYCFKTYKTRMVQNLCSPTPRLRNLDLYKLGIACSLL